jgi:hypothetical protein
VREREDETEEAALAAVLREAGVEVGYAGGHRFRIVVARRLLASRWLDRRERSAAETALRDAAHAVHNGAGDPEQEFYDHGVSPWLSARADAYLGGGVERAERAVERGAEAAEREIKATALREAAASVRNEKLYGAVDHWDWANWLERRAQEVRDGRV